MGADGHIRIYDLDKIEAYCEKRKDKYVHEKSYDKRTKLVPVRWPSYTCDWTCNGKRCCLVYFGDNIDYNPFAPYGEFGHYEETPTSWRGNVRSPTTSARSATG